MACYWSGKGGKEGRLNENDKKAYYHSNEKLKKTNELQKGYEEGLQIWKSTNFKKTIDKLITKDNAKKIFDLYTELGYKNELEENQGSAQDFDYIFNMTVASFQGNLHNFFQRIWLANHIMDEERNIELLDKLKKILSKKHDDFILLLVSIAESASFYLYIYKSLLNKSRVDKADAKNPKKMKSLAKNI